jgi:hypothetical protein
VFFEIMLWFCCCGQQNLRQWKKSHFAVIKYKTIQCCYKIQTNNILFWFIESMFRLDCSHLQD